MPPGLVLLKNFITDEYAAEVMSSISWDSGGRGKMMSEYKYTNIRDHYDIEIDISFLIGVEWSPGSSVG